MIEQIDPAAAWQFMLEHPEHVLIDVRDPIEFTMIGHPPGAHNVPLKFAPGWLINPDFLEGVRQIVPDLATPVLLLCRSGQRSQEAAEQLSAAGYSKLYNIREGFEGPLDDSRHRSSRGGWRYRGLPWEQS
ncbi:rhodanese domain protein [Methylococcus capsulatus str. Bath]|uniref:Rhodanese domain protein n=1 Tax=Methylococcus capsulatus (strain ATCC 33009 / NCIMB 11132 / Bath) TaxID=243233 RepID=Q603F5_METCA|nr:rhodanese-like domain-containing protein [Methylococcus capsulatus]AAU91117.1 rhodanese domain protein [Methylococcus capsulatus str. Bath]